VLCHRITKEEERKLLAAAKESGLSLHEYTRKKLIGR
jgi:hypothetical protein